ncbi:hypothetical protein MP228_011184 [Amoeboaphelidium protococcarum]|nr:hypothetical protein MP228_011184 [Amoeboaphelidium protococcarum]
MAKNIQKLVAREYQQINNNQSSEEDDVEMQRLRNADGQEMNQLDDRLSQLLRYKQYFGSDEFYHGIYNYYINNGLTALMLKRLLNLLIVAFVVSFSTFLISCIDHSAIPKTRQLSEALIPHCLSTINTFQTISLFLFVCFWIYEMMKMVSDWSRYQLIQQFYSDVMQIDDSQLSDLEWHVVVDKLVGLVNRYHQSQSVNTKFSAQDLTNMLMRRDNYLIALLNLDILDLQSPWSRMFQSKGKNIGQNQQLSKALQVLLDFCVFDYLFESQDQGLQFASSSSGNNHQPGLNAKVLKDIHRTAYIAGLRRRFILAGLAAFVLAPFVLVFLMLYFIFKYGEHFHKNPVKLSSRSFTPLVKWKIRDFNELPHQFERRLNLCADKASQYMNMFPSAYVGVLANFVAYISGSIALALTILSFVDDDFLLHFHITPGKSVLFYLGLFGVIYSASRSLVPDASREIKKQSAEDLVREVIELVHYYPSHWKVHSLNSRQLQREFSSIYQYKVVIFAQEILAVVTAPFLLCFSLPSCAEGIVDFFKENTIHVDGLGYVCSYSVFDFKSFDSRRGVIKSLDADDADSDEIREYSPNKMELSVMNFQDNYPNWEPEDDHDKEHVQMLRSMRNIQPRTRKRISLLSPNQTRLSQSVVVRRPSAVVENVKSPQAESSSVYKPPKLPQIFAEDVSDISTPSKQSL